MSRTVAFDFDGVLHSYESGWTGSIPTDPPVPGARECVEAFVASGYAVVVFSCRALVEEGARGIVDWLAKHGFPPCDVTVVKPHAILYVDDRAFRFEGDWSALMGMAALGTPRPWITPTGRVGLGAGALPKCGACGVEVFEVVGGRYRACGHRVPGARDELDALLERVSAEVRRASTLHGPNYASAHEAYGVLLEEVDEFREWVWMKRSERDRAAMAAELVQVAAVAVKYAAQLQREAGEALAAGSA